MQIEIDFDVFKALTARRKNENVTANDVLRELLKLGPKKRGDNIVGVKDVVYKGVSFPEGTQFRATYKGKTYRTQIKDGSYQDFDGKEYTSPSQAAFLLAGALVNGWKFWECQRPGESSWQVMDDLRTARTRRTS